MLIWTDFESFAITYPKISKTSKNLKSFKNFIFQFFANTKGLVTRFQAAILVEVFDKIFSFIILHTGQISLTDCIYFPSYSVKCICFMLRHFMVS